MTPRLTSAIGSIPQGSSRADRLARLDGNVKPWKARFTIEFPVSDGGWLKAVRYTYCSVVHALPEDSAEFIADELVAVVKRQQPAAQIVSCAAVWRST